MHEGADKPVTPDDSLSDTRTLSSSPQFRSIPTRIGPYRIVRLLGQGGMGAVYEAEQDQPRRTVALKVIKSAWASPELLRRFDQESQALARLHHPGIAQVYTAGTEDSETGTQPYFAMEFIAGGRTLTQLAKEHRLNARQRLGMVATVCDAVHHAHQRGIIHRDLKPGHILVDEYGQPKILDFGVARVTNSDTEATRQTDIGQLVGTLAYMSPEQERTLTRGGWSESTRRPIQVEGSAARRVHRTEDLSSQLHFKHSLQSFFTSAIFNLTIFDSIAIFFTISSWSFDSLAV